MDILEPNMYVRTNDGYINKIKKVNQYNVLVDARDLFGEELNIPNNEIIKSSHNIIDLIQVGDYVNESKVVDISIIGKDKEKWVWVEQMENTDNKYGDDYVGYNNEQIKSIVTKEQFESMSYKVQD